MNEITVSAFVDELEKIALSPKTVQRASSKLGVTPSYLKELVQRAGNKRRYFKTTGKKNRVSIAGEAAHDYDSRHSIGHTSSNVNQAREYTVRKLGRDLDKRVKRAGK